MLRHIRLLLNKYFLIGQNIVQAYSILNQKQTRA